MQEDKFSMQRLYLLNHHVFCIMCSCTLEYVFAKYLKKYKLSISLQAQSALHKTHSSKTPLVKRLNQLFCHMLTIGL